jgi:glucose/arabinose dehydrogenase
MTAGQHTVQIAAYIQADPIVESPRSAPLLIMVSGAGIVSNLSPSAATAPVVAEPIMPRQLVTSDGTRLRVDTVAAVDQPTAMAVADDGAVFVGDAEGRIRIARNGTIGDDVRPAGSSSGAVVDLMLYSPDGRTQHLYAVDATGGDAPSFRVARYRAVDGRLGEQAVILSGVAASATSPAAALAMGADGRLFVAFDDAGDPAEAARAGSYNGKVLRLNTDGTTPADQPGANPIVAANLQSPRSAIWDTPSSALWIADSGTQRTERLRRTSRRDVMSAVYPLRLAGGPAALAVYRSSLIPSWQGSLLAAPVGDDGVVVHARFTNVAGDSISGAERLAIPGATHVRLVKVGSDGTVYVGTDTEILKIGPE